MAVERRRPLQHARVSVLRSLNRNVERVFNPDSPLLLFFLPCMPPSLLRFGEKFERNVSGKIYERKREKPNKLSH